MQRQNPGTKIFTIKIVLWRGRDSVRKTFQNKPKEPKTYLWRLCLRRFKSPKCHFGIFLGYWPPDRFKKHHMYQPPFPEKIISTRQDTGMPPSDRAIGDPRPAKASFSYRKTHISINRPFPFKQTTRGRLGATFLIRVAPCLHFIRSLAGPWRLKLRFRRFIFVIFLIWSLFEGSCMDPKGYLSILDETHTDFSFFFRYPF